MAILAGYCGYLVHKHIPRLLGEKSILLIIAFGVQTIWIIVRGLSAALDEKAIVDLMQAPSMHGMTFVVYFAGNILAIIGLIMLNFKKIEIDLVTAQDEVKALQGIIPICMHCKMIRNDQGYWTQLEEYLTEHSEAQLSHGICEKCAKKYYPDTPVTRCQPAAEQLSKHNF